MKHLIYFPLKITVVYPWQQPEQWLSSVTYLASILENVHIRMYFKLSRLESDLTAIFINVAETWQEVNPNWLF